MESMRKQELHGVHGVKDKAPGAAGARRASKLFRVLVLGGLAIAVACASVHRGATGAPDDDPADGGGRPSW